MTSVSKEDIRKRRNGGPYGFGEPDDKTIEYNERFAIIPAFLREIIIRDYCSKWNDDYNTCRENNRWTKRFRCRKEFSSLKSCLKEFYELPHLKKQAEEEYLKERTMYRLTGVKRSEREKLNESGFEKN